MFFDDDSEPHWLDIDFDRDRIQIVAAVAAFIYLMSYINVNYPTNTDYFEDSAIRVSAVYGDGAPYQKSDPFSVLMMGQ